MYTRVTKDVYEVTLYDVETKESVVISVKDNFADAKLLRQTMANEPNKQIYIKKRIVKEK